MAVGDIRKAINRFNETWLGDFEDNWTREQSALGPIGL